MKLTIIGCHSASPRDNARPTAQLLEVRGHLLLIDCGEGTQMALRQHRVKFSRIKHIFISHLHGDHVYGLVGLVSTFCLLGRKEPLHIYGPAGIKQMIELQMELGNNYMPFELRFRESVETRATLLVENDEITVSTIPLDHRVYTNGFLIKEKVGDRHLNLAACEKLHIETAYYRKIKKGADYVKDDGEIIKNELLTTPGNAPKSYAFCSDTMYKEDIITHIKGATALYHESTFLKPHEHLCKKTKHSTAAQAATIAKKAEVGMLILGHYSSRYKSYDMFTDEARPIFPNSHCALDGKVFEF